MHEFLWHAFYTLCRRVLMPDSVNFMVKISGSPALIDDLAGVAEANASEIQVKSVGPADEVSHLRLGLTEVSTLIAIVNGAVTLAKFAWTIYKHLTEKKSDQLTVQTPLRTVVIIGSDAVSPERIQALLEDAVRP
jgi:hypothetical protein